MIKAFTQDIQRIIEVTPVQDVSGEVIQAKLYLDGCYKGLANTIRPEEDSAQVLLDLNNSASSKEPITATVHGKYRFDDGYTKLKQKTVHVSASSTQTKTISFDPQDYNEFRVLFNNSFVDVKGVTVLKRQYKVTSGIVVGGQAQEKIAVPCDFRRFVPAPDYHIIFVAEDTGVIGRDMLSLFANDGYGFEGCETE
jgi:hypothetical protein